MVLVMNVPADVSADSGHADGDHAQQPESAASRFRSRLFSAKSPKLNLCSCQAYQRSCETTFRSTAEDICEQCEELLCYVVLAEMVRHGADIPQKYLDSLPRTSEGNYMFKWRAVTLQVTRTIQQLRCQHCAKVDGIVEKINFAALTTGDCHAALASVDSADDPLSLRVALLLLLSSRIAVGLCSLQRHVPCTLSRGDIGTAAAEDFIASALAGLRAATWERLVQLLPDVTARGGWMQTMSDSGSENSVLVRIVSSLSTKYFALLGPALSLLIVFVIWHNKKGLKPS